MPEAISGFGKNLQRMGTLLAEAEVARNEVLNEVEAQNRSLSVKATVEEAVRGLEREPDARTHSQRAMRLLKDVGETSLTEATNEDVRQRMQKTLNPFALETFRATRKFENELLDQEGRVALQRQLDYERRLAAEMPDPRDQEAARGRGLEAIETAKSLGLLSPQRAFEQEQVFRKQIRLDKAGQEILSDPAGFLEHIETPAYADLTPDEKFTLSRRAEIELNRQDAQRRRLEAEAERLTKKLQDDNYRGLLNLMAQGVDVSTQLMRMGSPERREISLEQLSVGLALNMEARMRIDRPSDPNTFQRVGLDVHGTQPTTSEAEIDRLVASSKLNLKDGMEFKARLVINKEKMASNAALTRRHNQAEQILMNGLTTRSPFEALDPVSQKLKTQGLIELTRRSSLFDGNEDPLTVVREILPHLQKAFEDEAMLEETNVRKLLLYPTPQALEAAKTQIPRGTYEAQRKLFLDLDKRTQERLAIELRRKGAGK